MRFRFEIKLICKLFLYNFKKKINNGKMIFRGGSF